MQAGLFGDDDLAAAALPVPSGRLIRPLRSLVQEVKNDWAPLLQEWSDSEQGARLLDWVDARVASGATIFPADVFRALRVTPPEAVRVVILGQDPYHGPGQAEGLAFSVPRGQKLPPSLRNIFKELQRSIPEWPQPTSGHLGAWAQAGVLMLNAVLTVEQGLPASHAQRGWEALTDVLITHLAQGAPKVFLLWGAYAQSKRPLIDAADALGQHCVLQCNHPSPLSASRGKEPFIGSGQFLATQNFLSVRLEGWAWPPV